jgi:hypothetical protein
VKRYTLTVECLKDTFPALLPAAEKCNNILAWDLERIGYLARIFLQLGWLTEAETVEWLEKTAKRIKAEFPDWKDYIASVLVGRAVAFAFDYSVVAAAELVLVGGEELVKKHPVSSL